MNENIKVRDIEQFVIENGLFDTYAFVNSETGTKKDSTHEYGSKQIDTVLMAIGILELVKGCEITELN